MCICVGVYMRMCAYVCLNASVVFKNGKGSFTQCILVHLNTGEHNAILCHVFGR